MDELQKEKLKLSNDDGDSESTYGTLIDDKIEEDTKYSPLCRQILASSGPILITIFGAMVSGYSAILLPQLNESDSLIKVNKTEESWIASMAPLPMAIGCIIGGWSMEQHGRINANLIATVLAVSGWGFIYFGSTINWLLLGRLITGLSVGVSCPGATCYLGEVTHPKYRGFFLSFTALGIALGLFTTHLLGTFMHWKTIAAINTFLPVICIAAFAVVPESHVWHVKRNNFKKAQEAFFWFRGKNEESVRELVKIFNDKMKNESKQRSVCELFKECCKPQFVKPFLIMNLFFATAQFTGNNAVIFYSVAIMQSTVSSLDKYAATLIVDSIRVVMSVVGCILAKKYKVRPLTMISGLGAACSLYFLSFFVYVSEMYPGNGLIAFMPMIGFISYIVFISVGLMPLPWAICSELFPPATRGVGGGISICINFFAFFLVVKTSPDMFERLGTAGTFISYASVVLFCTAILYFVLPETKNKTLKDIEQFFSGEPVRMVDDGAKA